MKSLKQTKNLHTTAIIVMLALSMIQSPILEPAAAQTEPLVTCYGRYEGPGSVPVPGTSLSLPVQHPCKGFNDGIRTTGRVVDGLEIDENRDRLGDKWQATYEALYSSALETSTDPDGDGLTNEEEFWWLSNPFEADSDGDFWQDKQESLYWGKFAKGEGGVVTIGDTQYAYSAPGGLLDTDGDGITNMNDWDSDHDGLKDGYELGIKARPELADTDGDGLIDGGYWELNTLVPGEFYFAGSRADVRDTDGDGMDDLEEYQFWSEREGIVDIRSLNTDGDSLRNIHDPDSDNDGASDGSEVHSSRTDPGRVDTDGDSLPDGWEIAFHQNPLVDDANLDSDADGAINQKEYCHGLTLWSCLSWDYFGIGSYYQGGTFPDDADSEDDLLLDGEEMDAGTNPHAWDTDEDGMPDEFEIQYGLNPLDSGDASLDSDADSFDQNLDGTPELILTNLDEYRYGRPVDYDENTQGPWQLGTSPMDPDTDDDTANDAQEAYYGTDPRVPVDVGADEDQDGLNWSLEFRYGTDPNDPDTDGDGLCDGGRAPACTFPNLPGSRHPGELDYGSTPWMADSDDDGAPDGVEASIWDPEASGLDRDADGDLMGGITDSDSDSDGLLDGPELGLGTNLDDPDSDKDQLSDGHEVHLYGTHPLQLDSDEDGLPDGAEVFDVHTDPTDPDTDDDNLTDGAEVLEHGTDPFTPDTDRDSMPDGWEVQYRLNPRADDGALDPDADGLTSASEFIENTNPMNADTDQDDLPDGWEVRYEFDALVPNRNGDPDSDGLLNHREYTLGTSPIDWDTDDDGLRDSDEPTRGTDPLLPDSDFDGLLDGREVLHHGTNPLNRDSDGDGLTDFDEVVSSRTDPNDTDSDNDGLSDHDEVVTFFGKFNPNDWDTNDDGLSDSENVARWDCTTCDDDNDGVYNDQELYTYGTDPDQADTDCDGVEDGAEISYWSGRYHISTYQPYLSDADVDGDGIKDGIEIGAVGTPQQALYRTLPDRSDSDSDGLADSSEARNNVRVSCNQAQTRAAPMQQPEPPTPKSLARALRDASDLIEGALYEDTDGTVFGMDGEGVYIQGGYGVRLYPLATALNLLDSTVDLSELMQPWTMPAAAGTNGKLSDPMNPDSDGDTLLDGYEITLGTSPTACDSDSDGLGDALEMQVFGTTLDKNNPCTHLDSDPSTGTDPLNPDTDGDGQYLDGREDANANGRVDLQLDAFAYCAVTGETDPSDLDTDDDGLPDVLELASSGTTSVTSAWCFDSDKDGLSDGLELGYKEADKSTGTRTDITRTLSGRSIPTWQPSATGAILNPADPDMDRDGIIDGLEDLDHDGRFGLADYNTEIGAYELDPTKLDTDGDKISDGRELLMWGASRHAVPIAAVLHAWGGNVQGIKFDESNPMESDPLDVNTDGDPEGVQDGLDLNPRDDAFLAIDFGAFKMNEKPDHNDWTVELYFNKITIDIPFTEGGYEVRLGEATHVSMPGKSWTEIPGPILDDLENKNPTLKPSSIAAASYWSLYRLRGATSMLAVNLPDSGADLNPGSQKVTVKIWAKDWDPHSANDVLDFNPVSGAAEAIYEFDLSNILANKIPDPEHPHLATESMFADRFADDDRTNAGEGDAAIRMRLGDNIPEFFLQTVLEVRKGNVAQPPIGNTCYSGTGCV